MKTSVVVIVIGNIPVLTCCNRQWQNVQNAALLKNLLLQSHHTGPEQAARQAACRVQPDTASECTR